MPSLRSMRHFPQGGERASSAAPPLARRSCVKHSLRETASETQRARGSLKPSANSPSVMILIAAARRRCLANTPCAGLISRRINSSSNSIRKLVSSSSIARPRPPRPGAAALESLHGVEKITDRQCGSLREHATNDAGEGLLRILSLPNQEFVRIDFDRDGFGSQTQIMHGRRIGVKVDRFQQMSRIDRAADRYRMSLNTGRQRASIDTEIDGTGAVFGRAAVN